MVVIPFDAGVAECDKFTSPFQVADILNVSIALPVFISKLYVSPKKFGNVLQLETPILL